MALYFIIGVDQEGDASWNFETKLDKAEAWKKQADEGAFDTHTIYEIKVLDEGHSIIALNVVVQGEAV